MKVKSIILSIFYCCTFLLVSVKAITCPKPDYTSAPLNVTWIEKLTDGKSLSYGMRKPDDSPVVYVDSNKEYHMGGCKVYAEKSNRDYSKPYHLTEVILDGTRCTECIPGEIYYIYKEAVFRARICKQEHIIIILLIIIFSLLFICCLRRLFRYNKGQKKYGVDKIL